MKKIIVPPNWILIFVLYGGTRFFIFVVGFFGYHALPSLEMSAKIPFESPYHFYQKMRNNAFQPVRNHDTWFDLWASWDSEWFIDIAEHGYSVEPLFKEFKNVAVFPLFPLLIRLGNFLYFDSVFWGYWIACFAGGIFLLLFYEIALKLTDKDSALRAVLYYCCFPTSFYLSSVYSESLFLVLTAASFYCGMEKKWGWAGFFGGLSSLTRVTGVFLILPLGLLLWTQKKDEGISWKAIFKLLQIPIFFSLILLFFWWFTGNPLVFLESQKAWERSQSYPWTLLISFIHEPQVYHFMNSSHDFLATIFALCLLPFVCKRWPAFGIYSFYILILPLTAGTLMSMSRYFLSCFPLFIFLGVLGKSSLFDRLFLIISSLGLGLFSAMFACGYWIG